MVWWYLMEYRLSVFTGYTDFSKLSKSSTDDVAHRFGSFPEKSHSMYWLTLYNPEISPSPYQNIVPTSLGSVQHISPSMTHSSSTSSETRVTSETFGRNFISFHIIHISFIFFPTRAIILATPLVYVTRIMTWLVMKHHLSNDMFDLLIYLMIYVWSTICLKSTIGHQWQLCNSYKNYVNQMAVTWSPMTAMPSFILIWSSI